MPKAEKDQIIISTTNQIEGREIDEYRGVVSGITVLGFGFFREFVSSFRDVFGGRSRSYQKEYTQAQNIALNQIKKKARDLSADAVVGMHFDYESISAKKKSFIMVVVTGTAVTFKDAGFLRSYRVE